MRACVRACVRPGGRAGERLDGQAVIRACMRACMYTMFWSHTISVVRGCQQQQKQPCRGQEEMRTNADAHQRITVVWQCFMKGLSYFLTSGADNGLNVCLAFLKKTKNITC